MRRFAALLMVLVVTACDPVKFLTENSQSEPPTAVIIWSGNDGNKGHHLQMSFEQSGIVLSGNGQLYDSSVYPIRIHDFSISGTHTGTPVAGTIALAFTSQTMPSIEFKAVQEGDKIVGTLVGGLFGSGTEVTLSKTVR